MLGAGRAAGSVTEIEDETGYGDYRISLADGQSWFGGDNLAAELITNGDCSADSFTKGTGWTHDAGNEEYDSDGSQSTISNLYQSVLGGTAGLYKVVYTVSNYTAGNIYPRLYSGGTAVSGSSRSAVGTYTDYLTNDANTRAAITADADFIGSVDDITVKRVTSPAIYAGTGNLLIVTDSTGQKAYGYIGEVGTGETLGIELLSNPSFDANTTGWTPFATSTIDSVVGGVSNNALRITEDNTAANPTTYDQVTTVPNKEYCLGVWVKQGTESTYRSYLNNTGGYGQTGIVGNTESTATWARNQWYGVTGSTSEQVWLRQMAIKGSSTTLFFDEASWKEVTEPNPNSVMVYKEPHLATEGWLKIDSSFDPNDISTFEIYE